MVVFVENPPAKWNWRRQVIFGGAGLVISLVVAIALRRTSLDVATREFLGMLPVLFLLTLSGPMAGPTQPVGTRFMRAAAYATCVDLLFYFLMRAST